MARDRWLDSTLGAYRVESLLGRGGMGVVYLAEHVHLGKKVALKILPPELAEDEEYRQRFRRESRLASSLDHPNIVPVYDAGEDQDVLYVAMRYVEGTDLARVLRSEGALDPSRTLALLSQVADALDTAHQAGLVHRDVKPPNILLARSRQGQEHAYLGDFGLAKDVASQTRLTKSRNFVGTILYSPPEQFRGVDLDHRADVYSLGCVAYECLTGHSPYERPHDAAIMYAHLSDPVPRVSDARPELSPDLDEVIGRALAKEPDDRFDSAGELVVALEDAIASTSEAADSRGVRSEPTTETPAAPSSPTEISPTRRGAPAAPKQRRAPTPAAEQGPPARDPAGAAPPPRAGLRTALAIAAMVGLLGVAAWGLVEGLPDLLSSEPGTRFVVQVPAGTSSDVREQVADVLRVRMTAVAGGEPDVSVSDDTVSVVVAGRGEELQAAVATTGRVGMREVLEMIPPGVPSYDELEVTQGNPLDGEIIVEEASGGVRYRLGAELLGGDIVDMAEVVCPQGAGCQVEMNLAGEAADRFAEVTTRLQGRQVGILVDTTLLAAPTVADPIRDGRVVISGDFQPTEASDLATSLRMRPLPVDVSLQSTEPTEIGGGFTPAAAVGVAALLAFVVVLALFLRSRRRAPHRQGGLAVQ